MFLVMELPAEDVQSYPRPPALQTVPQAIRVTLGDVVVAHSMAALRVLETHHAPTYYIPLEDVQAELTAAAGGSFCEWKGRAQFWNVAAGGSMVQAAAWSYPAPSARFAALKDHIAIYAGKMQACFVGSVQVVPQPGDFYGGWITRDIVGPFKGGMGTWGW